MSKRGRPKKERSLDDGTLQGIIDKATTGSLGVDDCLHILGCTSLCDGDLYTSVCKGRRDNPNCLHGLVPALGGFRKKGLWQKNTEELLDLGTDPNTQRKEVRGPAHSVSGLNNAPRPGQRCAVRPAQSGQHVLRQQCPAGLVSPAPLPLQRVCSGGCHRRAAHRPPAEVRQVPCVQCH